MGEFKIQLLDYQEFNLFRIVDQVSTIEKVAGGFHDLLKQQTDLHQVIGRAMDCLSQIYAEPTLWLYSPEENKLKLVGRSHGSPDSPYADWAEPQYVAQEAVRRFCEARGRPILSVEDLDSGRPFINAGSLASDETSFILPLADKHGQIVFGVMPYADDQTLDKYAENPPELRRRSIRIVWSASNRIIDDEQGKIIAAKFPELCYTPPISPNNQIRDVAAKLHSMVLREVARRIEQIVSASGKDVKRLWDEEEVENGGVRGEAEPTESQPESPSALPKSSMDGQLAVLTEEEKIQLLELGERRLIQGQMVRLYEGPAEKFYEKVWGVINWLRETIMAVYQGTTIADGKSQEQLIETLSLQDKKMKERVIYSRYTALIEGPTRQEHDLLGVVSFSIVEVKQKNGRVLNVLKVPEAMIRKGARGKKMQVALTLEIGRRVLYSYWFANGFWKGLWLALTHGIPIYATSQSLRVFRDMSRLARFSALRTVEGKELTDEQKEIIRVGSEGKADTDGIEPNAYGGPVAISEEEAQIRVWGKKKDATLRKMLAERVGENGRVHLIGYLTLWVGIKTMLELFVTRTPVIKQLFGWIYGH